MEIPLTPMGAVRMTQNDFWKPSAQRYAKWKKDLAVLCKTAGYVPQEPLSLTFVLPVPKSCGKRERAERIGNHHRQVPDLDNMIKAFTDALLAQDASLAEYGVMKKVWGDVGKIIIH